MKKISKILFSLALIIWTMACQDSLNLAPEDYFGSGNFWKSEAQVNNFMVGLHKQFRDNQFQFLRLGEMRGGFYSNVDRQATSLNELPIIEQRLEETSPGVSNWAGFYGAILQINLFLNKLQNIEFIPDQRKQYLLGQGYAMRAYYYFHLLRTYGGVPLVLEPEVLNGSTDAISLRKKRSSEEAVLQAIKADINKAVEHFGSQTSPPNKSQWSPRAALMLQAEVMLWSAKVYGNTSDLVLAKSALTAAAGSQLLPKFSDVFSYGNKNNNEIILAIHNKVGESEMSGVAAYTYSTFNFNGLHYKDSTVSEGIGNFLVDPLILAASNSQQVIQRYGYTFSLFQSYHPADSRRMATFYDYYKVNTGQKPYEVAIRNTALVKFLGTLDANKRYFSDDWPVYREADRLLMLAEVVNAENGDPTTYVQAIRDRAFGPGKDPQPFVYQNQDASELAIFKERVKEFVFEGKHWYDLRRMKVAGVPLVFKSTLHPYGLLDKATQGYRQLWPIEANIWTNDPLVKQTPGYMTARPN
ncbi:RagB/SusD family nutrient uptake outer membrane protein [Dyadobacter tibetensis]|uniref:RagB/SusD family nutrient uptake outer membrane protein n=1 Tax=Dyadobacter tibetensis TaxID=1211851 RepID=UPI00046FBBD5|nr:RagB/SusD family nutrient uptake outer membrane protein [Dyadobacter tibetensis]